jgi:putative glutamine amidotransferase
LKSYNKAVFQAFNQYSITVNFHRVKKHLTIGVSDCSKFDNYKNWIEAAGNGVTVVKLSAQLDNANQLVECDGLLLTGGEDVSPELYSRPEYFELLDESAINETRDDFEWKLLEQWQQQKKPLLGICRGLQITNVFLGGSLIYDIPDVTGNKSHEKIDGKDQYHEVNVEHESSLFSILGKKSGTVNSAHHQSANDIGQGLTISAISPDNIVEALEWKEPEQHPWLILVQWHPERMQDLQDPFSFRVRSSFLEASSKQVESRV